MNFVYKSKCPDLKERFEKTIVLRKSHPDLWQEIKKPEFEKIATTAISMSELVEESKRYRVKVDEVFHTVHTYGYYGIFKPSLGEVLSQLPNHIFNREKVYLSIDLGSPNMILPQYVSGLEEDGKKYYSPCSFHHGIVLILSVTY